MKLISKRKLKRVILVFTTIVTIIMIFGIYDSHKIHQEHLRCEKEYHDIYDKYLKNVNRIRQELETIDGYQYDLQCVSEELYFSMTDFYNNSKDEVFRYVFEERFPNRYDFYQNPNEFYIIITALKENYPDFKNDENVNKWSIEVDRVTTKLHESVYKYRNLLKEYDDIVREINNCKFVTMNPEYEITKNEYKDVVIE